MSTARKIKHESGFGDHQIISIDELKVDFRYQRDEVSKKNTEKTAKGFNNMFVGAIVVMERANGDKFIIDGYQRYLAAKMAGVSALPCLVYPSEGLEHEAQAFKAINTGRTRVSAIDKFRSGVVAGEMPETEISAWLGERGYEVVKDGRKIGGIDFAQALVRWWRVDKDASQKAIVYQRKIIGDDKLHGQAHIGLWWLIHHGVDVEPHIVKLAKMGGLTAILRSIKTVKLEMGKTHGERVCGMGILRLINHRKRGQKIQMPDEV